MPWKGDKKKKYRIGVVLAVVFVMGLGLYLSRNFVAAKTRGFRSAHNLGKAEAYLEEEEFETSHRHALMARQLNPQAVEPLRVLVRAAFNARHVRTLDYCTALFLSPAATEDDKLLVLSILQQTRDPVGFVRFYNLLPKETRERREFLLLRTQFLIERNAYATARQLLEKQIEKNRDRDFLLLLASLLVQRSSTPEEMERGQRIIAELASVEEPDDTARTAFALLGFIDPDKIRPELLGDLGSRVETGGSREPREYIAAASLAIAAANNPEDRRAIVERAIDEQGEIAPAQLSAWLQRMDESENLLEFLTEERAAGRPDLYQQRFAALLQSGKLEEAGEWLETPPPGVGSINIWLARARLAKRKAERAEENNAWEQAFQVAQNTASQNEYLRIFEVAQSEQRVDLATRAILQAPKQGTGILPPAADVVAPMVYLTQQDRLDDLLYLTEALLAREPDNVVMVNNLLYLYLLRQEKIETSTDMAADLIAEKGSSLNPRNFLTLHTTQAMGLLLQGKNEEAMKVLPTDPLLWEKLSSDADRAIRALAFERNGKETEARSSWDDVDLQRLTTAEKRIFFPSPPEKKENRPRPEPAPPEAPVEGPESSSSAQTAKRLPRQAL